MVKGLQATMKTPSLTVQVHEQHPFEYITAHLERVPLGVAAVEGRTSHRQMVHSEVTVLGQP